MRKTKLFYKLGFAALFFLITTCAGPGLLFLKMALPIRGMVIMLLPMPPL